MYRFQMVRFFRTIGESLATPVITTALYFVVFGSAIGNRMAPVGARASSTAPSSCRA